MYENFRTTHVTQIKHIPETVKERINNETYMHCDFGPSASLFSNKGLGTLPKFVVDIPLVD